MTTRKMTITAAILAGTLLGATVMLAGVAPFWQGQTQAAPAADDDQAAELAQLRQERDQALARLDAETAQARDAELALRQTVADLEARLTAAQGDLTAWSEAYTQQKAAAQEAADALAQANRQIAAYGEALRQAQDREALAAQRAAQFQSQLIQLQGQYRNDTAALAVERDRLAADLDRAQRDVTALGYQLAQTQVAVQQAAQNLEFRLAALREDLRRAELREQTARTEANTLRRELQAQDRRQATVVQQLTVTNNRLEKENQDLTRLVAQLRQQLKDATATPAPAKQPPIADRPRTDDTPRQPQPTTNRKR